MVNFAYRMIAICAVLGAFVSGAALTSGAAAIREAAKDEGRAGALIGIPVRALGEINTKNL